MLKVYKIITQPPYPSDSKFYETSALLLFSLCVSVCVYTEYTPSSSLAVYIVPPVYLLCCCVRGIIYFFLSFYSREREIAAELTNFNNNIKSRIVHTIL